MTTTPPAFDLRSCLDALFGEEALASILLIVEAADAIRADEHAPGAYERMGVGVRRLAGCDGAASLNTEVVVDFVAHQLYLEDAGGLGVRLGSMRDDLKAQWRARAREKIKAWASEERRMRELRESDRAARRAPTGTVA